MNLDVEIRDIGTRDYWTRVNYTTVVPPGKSTLIIPLEATVRRREVPARADAQPERRSPGWSSVSATIRPRRLFVDNIRLERDDSPARVSFDGPSCV